MTDDWFQTLAHTGREACNTSALAAAVSDLHGLRHRAAAGTDADASFDVASLTKILCTTASLYHLVSHSALSLDDRMSKYLPEFGQNGKADITIRAVLGHRSGLPAWNPMFQAVIEDEETRPLFDEPAQRHPNLLHQRAKALILHQVMGATLSHAPGTRVYSDYGFIALGALIEVVTNCALDEWTRDTLFPMLGLPNMRFRRISKHTPDADIPPTGWSRPRPPAPGQEHLYTVHSSKKQRCPGQVDDDNAFALNGVAGHAGVFASAPDVAQFGAHLLRELDGQRHIGNPEVLQEMIAADHGGLAPYRGLGFDHASGPNSTAGARMTEQSTRPTFGHLGFTGCSLWIDPNRHLSVALLTNRVFPTRANVHGIKTFRPHFHDTLIAHIESS